MKHPDYPEGKFINYHAGPAPEVKDSEYPLIENCDKDPIYILENYIPKSELLELSKNLMSKLNEEIKMKFVEYINLKLKNKLIKLIIWWCLARILMQVLV